MQTSQGHKTLYQQPPLSITIIYPLNESMTANRPLLTCGVLRAPHQSFWNFGYFILCKSWVGHNRFEFMDVIIMVYPEERVSSHASSSPGSYILCFLNPKK